MRRLIDIGVVLGVIAALSGVATSAFVFAFRVDSLLSGWMTAIWLVAGAVCVVGVGVCTAAIVQYEWES
jgi:hypothetical protein